MTTVTVSGANGPVIVGRPDDGERGALSLALAASFARARQQRADAWILRPRQAIDEALFALAPVSGPRRIEPAGVERTRLQSQWAVQQAREGLAAVSRAAGQSFWLETYRELRRHIADERLPYRLRSWLRDVSQRAIGRVKQEGGEPAARFPRRLLREAIPVALPEPLRLAAAVAARDKGIDAGKPLVAVERDGDGERFREAEAVLVASGYQVVSLGDTDCALDLFLLLHAAFVVCTSPALQRVAYLTATPSLTLNVIDPIGSYPVRGNGLITLATPIDLETGRALPPPEMLSEGYQRHLHRYGVRRNTSAQVAQAVREMLALLAGSKEKPAQATYRTAVLDAGAALAVKVSRVRAWGPDEGFIGDGRLVAWQAEQIA